MRGLRNSAPEQARLAWQSEALRRAAGLQRDREKPSDLWAQGDPWAAAAPARVRLPGGSQGLGRRAGWGEGKQSGVTPAGSLLGILDIGPMRALWMGGKVRGHPTLRPDSTLLLRTEVTQSLPLPGSPGERGTPGSSAVKAVSGPLGPPVPPPSPALLGEIPGNPPVPPAPPRAPGLWAQ